MFTITVNVSGVLTEGAVLTNTASISSHEFDGNPSNNQTFFDSVVVLSPDLSITKASSPAAVRAGDPVTYTIMVTDNGPSQATGVVVTDPVPSGVLINSAMSSPGTVCSVTGVTCTLSSLAPGASAYITISANIDPNRRSNITNVATVSSGQVDPFLGNNVASARTVSAVTVLTVTKTSNPGIATAGESLTYTLNVTNTGPSTANGVVLTDTLDLPSRVSFITASGAPFTRTGTTVVFQMDSLAPGASASVSVVVAVDSTATVVSSLTNVVKADLRGEPGWQSRTPCTRRIAQGLTGNQ